VADLGGPDGLTEAQISICRRASTIECELEAMEPHLSASQSIDLGQYARLVGCLCRLFELIGIKGRAKLLDPMGELVRAMGPIRQRPLTTATKTSRFPSRSPARRNNTRSALANCCRRLAASLEGRHALTVYNTELGVDLVGIPSAEAVGQPGITGGRKPNAAYRSREHLTEAEVFRLMEAARDNRYGARDAALIFTMYRHGLRVSEVCALDWSAIDFEQKELHARRSKLGKPATHPIRGDELRALRRVHRDAGSPRHGPVFVPERGAAFTRDGINKLIARAGAAAGFGYRVHPHMLRHACGFALAKAGHDTRRLQDYLGHKSINSTVRYTELDASKFSDFWR
jgi:integrase